MRRYLYSILCLLCSLSLWAQVNSSTPLADYYFDINETSDDAIRSALNATIKDHTVVSYDNLRYLFQWTDTYDSQGEVIDDIYSDCDPAYTTSWCSGTCGYNREHSVPKSWFGQETPLYSDAFHLYPTNCDVNSYRGNEPYGECAGGTKSGNAGAKPLGRKGKSTFASYTTVGTVYEPDDEFKGDLARTYFYMVTRYMTTNFTQATEGKTMFTYSGGKADLSRYSVTLLLKWHRQDPVSERELRRNEVIYGNKKYNKCAYKQGNRNPFIDYPELAEYIWGDKKGQKVKIYALDSPYANEEPRSMEKVEQVEVAPVAVKVIIHGQLFIEINGQLYTIMGQRVQ